MFQDREQLVSEASIICNATSNSSSPVDYLTPRWERRCFDFKDRRDGPSRHLRFFAALPALPALPGLQCSFLHSQLKRTLGVKVNFGLDIVLDTVFELQLHCQKPHHKQGAYQTAQEKCRGGWSTWRRVHVETKSIFFIF